MIDETDEVGGRARAALALSIAITNEVREGGLTPKQARAIFATARWLVRNPESFSPNPDAAEAADNFLSVAQAQAQVNAPTAGCADEKTRSM